MKPQRKQEPSLFDENQIDIHHIGLVTDVDPKSISVRESGETTIVETPKCTIIHFNNPQVFFNLLEENNNELLSMYR